MKPVTLFVGDGEHPLALTSPMVREVERKLGSGIGAILARFQSQAFGFDDVREIIRCALIGGGMDPREADHLAATYIDERPLAESTEIALAVLMVRFFGADEEPAPAPDAPLHDRVAAAFAAHDAGEAGNV